MKLNKKVSMAALWNTCTSAMLAIITLGSAAMVSAETPEEKGLRIAIEAKNRDRGWQDSYADMRMVLRNKQGEESEREIVSKTLEQENDGDKGLTIFNKPKDVKGTAFLSFSHPIGPDDQWLYLPALKRVKRISSSNKSGPFMGTEFSFEDLSSFEVEKYTYKYLRDEAFNKLDNYVVEQYPVDENSGYTRRVVWLDKEEYRTQKIDFYDRKNSLLKTLIFEDYQQFLGKFWRPGKAEMVNHQTGKSTTLEWSNYAFKTGLDESDFNRNALKRAK
ncbi:outer membrane lipoprotein-sorting protein [Agaribacter flavus]|uniref:Outer membrane lipoprotein-sorting protein n=1 Tax=Agaribacter flavus TaxID=1902781 RepID=A0ABV7FIG9_9ALTE